MKSLALKIADLPTEWLCWYMLNKLGYSKEKVRSAILGVSEQARYTCKIATWDHHTLIVTIDMTTAGRDNYVKESTAAMVDHG